MSNKTIKLKNSSKTIAHLLYLDGFSSYLIYETKLDNNKLKLIQQNVIELFELAIDADEKFYKNK
jgi:hypothetical protein